MIFKQSSGISPAANDISIVSASTLTGNEELWAPSNAFYARLKKYGPLILRISMPTTSGEERLVNEWISNLKGIHPLFIPLGTSTPTQILFNSYRRCSKSHKENRCITVALAFPWKDPAAIGKSSQIIDPISQRQALAKFNFMALSFYTQQYSFLCRKILSDVRYTEPDAYHLTAAVETFTREVYSLLTEESLKTIDTFWASPLEASQTIQGILTNPAWNELRSGLINQLLSLGGIIDAIYRLNIEDKVLKSIAHTGYLLAKLMLEEINSSATRPKEDIPLEWDAKALLWQSVSMRLKFIPIVLGTDQPGLADVLFGFFTASGTTKEQISGSAHYHMILQWNELKQHWNDIIEHRGINDASTWIQKIKDHPQGDLSKGIVGLVYLQEAFYSTLEELSHKFIGMQHNNARVHTDLPASMAHLLPAFTVDERGNAHPAEFPSQLTAMIVTS
ncbi:MAG: hypothetical protein WC222_02605 [Parachlamydiales bacterium]